MGCFNTTGFISKTPILYGDRVVCIIAKINHGLADLYSYTPYYPFSLVTPQCLPVRGTYNDYGSVEKIDDTPTAKLIAQLCKTDNVEGIFDTISSCGNEPIEHELKRWYSDRKEYEATKRILNIFDKKDIPTLLFEHEDFYDKLTEKNHFKVSWQDKYEGKKITTWDKFWKNNTALKNLFEKYPEETKLMEPKIKKPKGNLHKLLKKAQDNYDKLSKEELETLSKQIIDAVGSSYQPCRLRVHGNYNYRASQLALSYINYCNENKIKGNMEFVDTLDKLELEPLIWANENEDSFTILDKIKLKNLPDFYENSKEEIRRIYNMYFVMVEIPMYVGLSQTAGNQHYNFDILNNLLKLSLEQSKKSLKEHGRDYI